MPANWMRIAASVAMALLALPLALTYADGTLAKFVFGALCAFAALWLFATSLV